MFFSKKLKNLDILVEDLKDDEVYLCISKNKKGEILDEEPAEIVGKELKALVEMQGQRRGLIRYGRELFYEVIGTKEKAEI